MLGLTRKTDYALVALAHLARQGDALSSAREIAERYGVPLPLLMNILKELLQHGFVRSVRGAKGGYTLAVAPEDVSLERLVEALEGPIRLVTCAAGPADGEMECDLAATCPVRRPVQRVHEHLRVFLRQVTLADLVGDGQAGLSPAASAKER